MSTDLLSKRGTCNRSWHRPTMILRASHLNAMRPLARRKDLVAVRRAYLNEAIQAGNVPP
eukprot:CAMPEP_0183420786 /NCGR_PEP_ID=MMETSP0370-20130417/26674_1 /TAXON_ID=268820 /ORGANISM="Peridinium aciculiferum, Strain PAER-2" /LENGTH=59 /DNA_ID=CAMNT_0025604697 /DNA_START=1 /DNA_END=176 /DNA_ORIENTATION=-